MKAIKCSLSAEVIGRQSVTIKKIIKHILRNHKKTLYEYFSVGIWSNNVISFTPSTLGKYFEHGVKETVTCHVIHTFLPGGKT